MKRLVIHIGHGKTGTTALQDMFFLNRDVLSQHGLMYPATGIPIDLNGPRFKAHHLLCNDLNAPFDSYQRAVLINVYSALREEIEREGKDRILLSSEHLCFASSQVPWLMKEAFSSYDVRILYVVRRQDSLIRSAYLQAVKEGADYSEESLLAFMQRHASLFEYDNRLVSWEQAFGIERIDCLLYEARKDIRSALMEYLKIQIDASQLIREDENPSLGFEFVEILRRIHSLSIPENQKNELVAALHKIPVATSDALEDVDFDTYRRFFGGVNEAFARRHLERRFRAYFEFKREYPDLVKSLLAKVRPKRRRSKVSGRLQPVLQNRKEREELILDYALMLGNAYGCCGEIYERDETFSFLLKNPVFEKIENAIQCYFNVGNKAAKDLVRIIGEHCEVDEGLSVLEVGTGAGYITRHLPGFLPGIDISTCGMSPEADDYLRTHLRISVVPTTLDPLSFVPNRRFRVIIAVSFFTQLPKEAWALWMKTLTAQVEPGGILVFTTHGQLSLSRLGNPEVPSEGFWYCPRADLQKESHGERGLTVALRSYVAKECEELGGLAPLDYQEGAFFGHQDLYVFRAEEGPLSRK